MNRTDGIQIAIDLGYENTRTKKGRPFGAIIVKGVVGKGVNNIVATPGALISPILSTNEVGRVGR